MISSYSRVSARSRFTVAIASVAKRIPGPKSRYVPRGVLGPYKGIWGSSCLDPMRFTHSRVRPSARYDGRRRRRRIARSASPLYAADGGANGERLAFLPVGRFLRSPLFLSPSRVSFSSSKGAPLEELRSLSRGKFPFLARDRRNSTVHVDYWRTGVAGVSVGRWSDAGSKGEAGGRKSKSAQRGWKRNCFVSESTVCVLT